MTNDLHSDPKPPESWQPKPKSPFTLGRVTAAVVILAIIVAIVVTCRA